MKLRYDVDGLLFFDKRTGTNILFDEIPSTEVDIAPRHISIALTNKCNFSCPYCYIKHGTDCLQLDTLKKWVDQLNDNGCLSIGLGGGEPTLWPDLLELLSYISQTEMAVTLTTNGSADISCYKEILKYVNLLRFSVDGLHEVYETNRGQSFFPLITKIHELVYCGKVGLNYLLTDETVLQLDEFKEYIDLICPYEILLIPCINSNGNISLSNHSIAVLNKWLLAHVNKLPISLSYAGLGIISSDILPVQNFSPDMQHRYFLHINSQGELANNVFASERLNIGNNLIEVIKKKGML